MKRFSFIFLSVLMIVFGCSLSSFARSTEVVKGNIPETNSENDGELVVEYHFINVNPITNEPLDEESEDSTKVDEKKTEDGKLVVEYDFINVNPTTPASDETTNVEEPVVSEETTDSTEITDSTNTEDDVEIDLDDIEWVEDTIIPEEFEEEDIIKRDNLKVIYHKNGSVEITNLPKFKSMEELDNYLLSLSLDVNMDSISYIYNDETGELIGVIINEPEEKPEADATDNSNDEENSGSTYEDNIPVEVPTTEPEKVEEVVDNDTEEENVVEEIPLVDNNEVEEEESEEETPQKKFFLDMMNKEKEEIKFLDGEDDLDD